MTPNESKTQTEPHVRLVDHRPGQRILQVDVREARLIKTSLAENGDDTATLLRSVNGGDEQGIFTGSRAEARRVLDMFAEGEPAPGRRFNLLYAGLAAIGLVGLGYAGGYAMYEGMARRDAVAVATAPTSSFPGLTASVHPPSVPPELPAVIGSSATPAPPVSPNGATGEGRKAPKAAETTPPTVDLPKAAQAPAAAPQAIQEPKAAAPAAAERRLPSVAAPADAKGSDIQNGLAARADAAQAAAQTAGILARKDLETKGPDAMISESEQLKKVLDQLSNGEKITPEVLASLPNDIAKALRNAGVVLDPNEAALATKAATGREFRIVNLPPSIVDRYKDADGIPTIPPANSWANTGGNVIIPLPGGGEIRSPDDLAAFHLQK